LQRHVLAAIYADGGSAEPAAHRLRREFLDAIEGLNPGRTVSFRSPHMRIYNLLSLHYVQSLTLQEAIDELAISIRQAYRDLKQAHRSIAEIIWTKRQHTTPDAEPPAIDSLTSLSSELAQIDMHRQVIDIRQPIRAAHKTVEPLSRQRGITMVLDMPNSPVYLSTTPTLTQQVFVNLLSTVIRESQGDEVTVALHVQPDKATDLLIDLAAESAESILLSMALMQAADQLGWRVHQFARGPSLQRIRVQLAADHPTILIIDDNDALIDMMSRYLTQQACQVISANNGQDGWRLARELPPDAIILDVMMPHVDGWELLQRLRTHPDTVSIPIIICSVFDDPDLAFSLGATDFLPKPVNQHDIIAALHRVQLI
jgi:CheY-like chemotaxis protein